MSCRESWAVYVATWLDQDLLTAVEGVISAIYLPHKSLHPDSLIRVLNCPSVSSKKTILLAFFISTEFQAEA